MFHRKARYVASKEKSKIIKELVRNILFLTIPACCYCVTAYAWFQINIVNSNNTIQMAEYGLNVSVTEASTGDEAPYINDKYTLKQGVEYIVSLEATGTANSGYCIVSYNDKEMSTCKIEQGSIFTFNLLPENDADYTFTAHWGEPENIDISNQTFDKIDYFQNNSVEFNDIENIPSLPENTESTSSDAVEENKAQEQTQPETPSEEISSSEENISSFEGSSEVTENSDVSDAETLPNISDDETTSNQQSYIDENISENDAENYQNDF